MITNNLQYEMIRSELELIVGQEHVSTKESDRLIYSTDWFWLPQMRLDRGELNPTPDYIVHPDSAEQVAAILKIANTYKVPVIPWGGGSGSQGGALSTYGGIILDLKRLNKLIDINEEAMTVTAQAGINGTQLEWAVNEKGMTLPHYAASSNCATLGGYLAPRGSGTVSTKYGKAEDLVLGMEIVLPTGEIMRTPAVPNHAAGPDFYRLFLGSEGTLGVITEATMQIDYLPEARLMRGMLFTNLSDAIAVGREIMVRRLDPMVIRLYDPSSTASRIKKILGYELEGAYMVFGFDGDPELAALQEQKALDICERYNGQDLGREPGESWWEHRYDFYYPPQNLKLPRMYGTTETVSTFDNVEKIYWAQKRAIEETYPDLDISYIAHFSHWFHWGSSMYSRFIVENPPEGIEDVTRLHNRIWDTAMTAVLANGGMINEHHGVGLKLARHMRHQYPTTWPMLERIKNTLDPNGIMNPGKLGFGG